MKRMLIAGWTCLALSTLAVHSADYRWVPMTASDLVYSPATDRLYASTPASAIDLPNRIVALDPGTVLPDGAVATSNNPARMALSADGLVLYVACENGMRVQRVGLQPLVAGASFGLGSPLSDLAVSPVDSQTLAVAAGSQVILYDGGVPRPNVGGAFASVGFDPTMPDKLFGSSGSFILSVFKMTPSGVTFENTLRDSMRPNPGWDFKMADGIAWFSGGRVVDARTLKEATGFKTGAADGWMEMDRTLERIFFLVQVNEAWRLDAFDLRSRSRLGSVALPELGGTPRGLTRYREHGIAFSTSGGQLFLVESPRIIPRGSPTDLVAELIGPPETPVAGCESALEVRVSNRGSFTAPGTVLRLELSVNADFVNLDLPQGSFVRNGNEFECAIGSLAPGVTLTNRLLFRPTAPGLFAHSAVAFAEVPDPTFSNNHARIELPVRWQSLQSGEIGRLILPAADLVYSTLDGKLYVSVPEGAGSRSHTVTALDPQTGDLGSSIPVGNGPGRMAISDDGQFIYVCTEASNRIDRIDVATGTRGLSFTLGADFKATDLNVMPGQPRTIAVAGSELRIYEDGLLRPNTVPIDMQVEFGTNGSVLYGFDNWIHDRTFTTMEVNADGAVVRDSRNYAPLSPHTGLLQAGGLIYTTAGTVLDPETVRLYRPFAGNAGGPTAVDLVRRRVCYLAPERYSYGTRYLRILDLDTSLPIESIPIPLTGSTRSLVRWGDDGLAYISGTNEIVSLRSRAIPVAPPTDIRISQALCFAQTNAIPILRCAIENLGPNSIVGGVMNIQIQTSTNIGSVNASMGAVTVTSNRIVCEFGVLDPGATNVITVHFSKAFSNQVLSVASVSSLNRELKPGDNTSLLLLAQPPLTNGSRQLILDLPIVDLVKDSRGNGIYMAVDGSVSNLGNGIIHFNPTTGVFSPSTHVGANISCLSATPDGTTLYVASDAALTRISTSGLEVADRFGTFEDYDTSAIRAFSDRNDQVAVWHRSRPDHLDSTTSRGLFIYTDGEFIAATDAPGWFRRILEANDGRVSLRSENGYTTLDVFRWHDEQLVPESSVVEYGLWDLQSSFSIVDPKHQQGKVFTGTGWVYEMATRRLTGTCAVPGSDDWPTTSSGLTLVEPDLENGRIYFLKNHSGAPRLHVFDADRYQLLNSIAVPGIAAIPDRLIRWGSNGFAFKVSNGKVFVLQTSLVPTGADADLSLTVSGGANPATTYGPARYRFTVTNQGPETAPEVTATLGFSLRGSILNPISSHGTISNFNERIFWNVGSLAAQEVAQFECDYAPHTYSLLQVTGMVSGVCRDRVPGNDSTGQIELVVSADVAQITSLPLPVRSAVSDGTNFFVTLRETAGPIGNSIVRFNFADNHVSPPLYVGSNPGFLCLGTDPNQLYVAVDGESAIRRVDVSTWQAESAFSISNGSKAEFVVAVPNVPDTLAVSRTYWGLAAYSGGEQLPCVLPDLSGLAVLDTTGELYGYDKEHSGIPLVKLEVFSGGLAVAHNSGVMLRNAGIDLRAAQGLFYTDAGLVVSPEAEIRRFPVSGAVSVLPMTDLDRAVFMLDYPARALSAFEISSGRPVGYRSLLQMNGTPGDLWRCAGAGLAFVTSADQIIVLRDVLVSEKSAIDLAIANVESPPGAIAGSAVTLTMTITNRSEEMASSVTLEQTFASGVSVKHVSVSSGTAVSGQRTVLWNIGSAAPHMDAEIAITFTAANAQTVGGVARLISESFDPMPANNVVQFAIAFQEPSTNLVINSLDLRTADLVYDKARRTLWASSTNTPFGPALVPIHPITGTAGPGFDVFSPPGRIAVDSGGQHVHFLLPAVSAVGRLNSTNGVLDAYTTIYSGSDSNFVTPLDIASSPDQPLRVAVGFEYYFYDGFVALIEDGVLQPRIGEGYYGKASIVEFNSPGDGVYTLDNTGTGSGLMTYAMTNGGFEYRGRHSLSLSQYGADIKRAGSLLYCSGGEIVDPRSDVIITNLGIGITATAVEPSLEDNRVYYATRNPFTLRVFNLTNHAFLGSISLPAVPGEIRGLVRCGIGRLAIRTTGGRILMVQSPLVPVEPGIDTDNDGIPDDWEVRYNSNPYLVADAQVDSDDDGSTNLAEFRAGTDPHDRLSVFRVTVENDGSNWWLSIPSVAGRLYHFETTGVLEGEWSPIGGPITGTGHVISNRLSELSNTDAFYRVKILP